MRWGFLGLFLALACSPALANDSTAELATGGLKFVASADIEMRSEDLFISTAEIRVGYRFFNNSGRDVTTLVAFPMPDITIAGPDDNIAVPTEDPENVLDFHTTVAGKPVAMQVEQKVFAQGLDRTELLRKLGIPLQPQLAATNDALDGLPQAQWDDLIKLGLADVDEYDAGKGMKKHLEARWTLKTTYYWEQTFPAKSELVIEHRYKPSVGSSAGTMVAADWAKTEPSYRDYMRKYCIDASLVAAVQRLRKSGTPNQPVEPSEQRIAYILKTGANWDGPIKNFHLTVDKGDPNNLVSFCGEGVKKISATQFEMRKTDFTPTDDFYLLIVTKPGGG
ncbi:MAG: DUF4424 domain-containing protein [Methylobacteriaceae bacterium]|nr:DUF4424 domain-containing protein [Methylobacteriaceae bacterium]MBV9243502.1 DUF4424 domain-containing protein [Methylobacteriaceae bacterium]